MELTAARSEAMPDVADWLELYRRLWEDNLDSLEEYLRELQAKHEEEDDDDEQ
jgi:hypothetical protein